MAKDALHTDEVGSAVVTGVLGASAWMLRKGVDLGIDTALGTGKKLAVAGTIAAGTAAVKGGAKVAKGVNTLSEPNPQRAEDALRVGAAGAAVLSEVGSQFKSKGKDLADQGISSISEKSLSTLEYVSDIVGERTRPTSRVLHDRVKDAKERLEFKLYYNKDDVDRYLDEYADNRRPQVDPTDSMIADKVMEVEEAVAVQENGDMSGMFDEPENDVPTGLDETEEFVTPVRDEREVTDKDSPRNDFRTGKSYRIGKTGKGKSFGETNNARKKRKRKRQRRS